MSKYNHREIESKWWNKWEKDGIYNPDINSVKNPFYNLWMFPYPSGEGLHAGHAFASTGSDVFGRFMRMNQKTVFQPIGYDSFGIHAENYALKIGERPEEMLKKTTAHYKDQLMSLGHGYDWTRTVTTSDINYYRWTQWLFTELFKAGLAYRKKAAVNWCLSCKTVLADEQVIEGKCERCGTVVEKKELEQWWFRITDYADRLLANLDKIDWSERVKVAQKNWIGRSEGAIINFKVKNSDREIKVFTTRPDTLYGATFLVLSPKYPEMLPLVTPEHRQKVTEYINEAEKKEDLNKDKTGVFTGSYVINPATKEKIPVYVADYVLIKYGTGAIMGVPAHDERDFEFTKKYQIPVKTVVVPLAGSVSEGAVYSGEGTLVNSGEWDGWRVPQEFSSIILDIERKGWGKGETAYHLRDWLISRQRYWGPPIPLIYCPKCAKERISWFSENRPKLHEDQSDWDSAGWFPEENLPIALPYIEDYKPEGTGKGPLANHPEFYKTKCPACGGEATRETDVSDVFLDSTWYFLRYPTVGLPDANEVVFDSQVTKKWLPVDLYFGGAEHAVLHLMYSRFTTMVLHDLDMLSFEEPFPKFFAHGLMIKEGAKMSKSKGNVVNPDAYIEKFGADAFRLYVMFMGPMDGSPDFRDTGIEGMARFVDRLWILFIEHKDTKISGEGNREIEVKMHQTIKKVTEDMQNFRYNTAISIIMEFVNLLYTKAGSSARVRDALSAGAKQGPAAVELSLSDAKPAWNQSLMVLAQLLAPFAPYFAEEVWTEVLGQPFSVHTSEWPKYDVDLAREEQKVIVIQVNGKLRGQLMANDQRLMDKEKVEKMAKKDTKVAKWLKGKSVKNIVFIPGKLINFVTNE